jgi:hypothetical protein
MKPQRPSVFFENIAVGMKFTLRYCRDITGLYCVSIDTVAPE